MANWGGIILLWSNALLFSTLVAMAVSRPLTQPYHVSGKVYCDTCHCGFETSATTYIPGATVELQCMDRSDSRLVYTSRTKTNHKGTFKFVVNKDHGDHYCDVVLVASPWAHCRKPDPVRSRSRVIVTNYNGLISSQRFANALGFFQDQALPICPDLLKFYLQSYDDI